MPIRSLARLALPISMTLSASALGCGGTTASEPAASASAAATRAPIAQQAHGAVKLFGDALGDVPMTAPQRSQIEQLAIEAEARHTAVRATRKDFAVALAAQVQAGSIDRRALGPTIDAVKAAVSAAEPADRAAIERLHAILGRDQRTEFVDALEARLREHMGQVHGGRWMRDWAIELKLSDDQRAQIKAALEQRGQAGLGTGSRPWVDRRQRGAKWLDAFKEDRFVLDEVAPARQERRQEAIGWFLGVAEAALPVLTPEQRAIAAEKLRARAEDLDGAGPMLP